MKPVRLRDLRRIQLPPVSEGESDAIKAVRNTLVHHAGSLDSQQVSVPPEVLALIPPLETTETVVDSQETKPPVVETKPPVVESQPAVAETLPPIAEPGIEPSAVDVSAETVVDLPPSEDVAGDVA